MKWLKALLAAAVLLPCLGMLAIHLFFRIFHATDLTVEVVNQRAESVPEVMVEFGTQKCGPTDLVPSQSITCRYDRGKGGVEFLLGRPPRVRLMPNNYVMGGRPTAHRLTLEADGGATFDCLSGWCASDGGALPPVAVQMRAAASLVDGGIDAGVPSCELNCSLPGCFQFGTSCYRRCEQDEDCSAGTVCVCPDAAKCMFKTIADEMPNPGKNWCVWLPPNYEGALARRRLLREMADAGSGGRLKREEPRSDGEGATRMSD